MVHTTGNRNDREGNLLWIISSQKPADKLTSINTIRKDYKEDLNEGRYKCMHRCYLHLATLNAVLYFSEKVDKMKNIIIKSIILFLLSFLFLSCSQNNLTNPIGSEIIGKWKGDNNYSITFFNNGKFIDTIYSEGNTNPSYRDYAMFVRTGNYKIDNEILYLNDFSFVEVNAQSVIGMVMIYISYEVSIDRNNLIMKPVNIFSPQSDNSNQLTGDWILNGYYCVYSQNIEPHTSHGQTTEEYYFYKDSSTYKYNMKYLDGVYSLGSSSYNSQYTYNKPYLDLPTPSYYHVLVKFIGNRMFWYYNYSSTLHRY